MPKLPVFIALRRHVSMAAAGGGWGPQSGGGRKLGYCLLMIFLRRYLGFIGGKFGGHGGPEVWW